jgi:hypothetical protein
MEAADSAKPLLSSDQPWATTRKPMSQMAAMMTGTVGRQHAPDNDRMIGKPSTVPVVNSTTMDFQSSRLPGPSYGIVDDVGSRVFRFPEHPFTDREHLAQVNAVARPRSRPRCPPSPAPDQDHHCGGMGRQQRPQNRLETGLLPCRYFRPLAACSSFVTLLSVMTDLSKRIRAIDAILAGSTTIDRALLDRCFASLDGLNLSAMPLWQRQELEAILGSYIDIIDQFPDASDPSKPLPATALVGYAFHIQQIRLLADETGR